MKNLIENDPLVTAIFEAVAAVPSGGNKLAAVIRAGKIAQAYADRLPADLRVLEAEQAVAKTFP
jgi:hypothetical protein